MSDDLELRVEWQEAPGVTTPHLAATWARLEVWCADRAVTRFWSHRSDSVRPAVYSSVFPLAKWIVRRWWHLLHEGLRAPSLATGARAPRNGSKRDWMARHSLLLAREGMAYPDLATYRQGDEIALRWLPDPEHASRAGRFMDEGFVLLPRPVVVDGFTRFLETVMDRLDGVGGDEVQELADEWAAIRGADADEAALCSRLAALGMDPYDPDADEALEEAVARLPMQGGMLRDLLDASSPAHLLTNAATVERLDAALPKVEANGRALLTAPIDPRPYETGYVRARRLREDLKQPADRVLVLDELLDSIGAEAPRWMEFGDPSVHVEGVVRLSGRPAMAATARSPQAQRFLVARALHHWYFVPADGDGRRLLSRSTDWEQAASRAFAAELLAPAAALAEHLQDATWDSQDVLAAEFQVSGMVIAHQIENHDLL